MANDTQDKPIFHASMDNPHSPKTEQAVEEMLHVLHEQLTNTCISPFVAGAGPPAPENPTCDVCGYQHPTPHPFIVMLDNDGVIRCSRCRMLRSKARGNSTA